jgi:hypothetical protein
MSASNPFNPLPPDWVKSATHAYQFCCPKCQVGAAGAKEVWINRGAPVFTELRQRKWQEFYLCNCGCAWWGWSSDRPLTELSRRNPPED